MMRLLRFSVLTLGIVSLTYAQQEGKPPESEDIASSGKVKLTLNPGGHYDHFRMRFTPDGKRLVTFSSDNTIHIWNIESGERERVIRVPVGIDAGAGGIQGLAIHPDGKTLAVVSGGWPSEINTKKGESRVLLFHLHDGKRLGELPQSLGAVRSVHFLPDGRVLLQPPFTRSAILWDLHGADKPRFLLASLPQEKRFMSSALSPDGNKYVAGSNGGEVFLWDLPAVPTKKQKGTVRKLGSVGSAMATALAFSPKSDRVAAAAVYHQADAIHVWDTATGKLLHEYPRAKLGPLGQRLKTNLTVTVIRFINDDEVVLLGSVFNKEHPIRTGIVLNLKTGVIREGPSFPEPAQANWIEGDISADGKLAAMSGSKFDSIVLWDTTTGKTVKTLGGRIDNSQHVGWTSDSKAITWSYRDPLNWRNPPWDRGLDLSAGRPLTVQDLAEKKVSGPLASLDGWVLSHAYTQVGVHPAKKLKQMRWIPEKNARHISAFSLVKYQKKVHVAVGYGDIDLFDVQTGKKVHTVTHIGMGAPSLAPSPDGRLLLVARAAPIMSIYALEKADPDSHLLDVFVQGADWIAWTRQGYYAASPGGEKLMGWTVANGPDKAPDFFPAERFRKQLYRPDIIKLVLEKASVTEAIKMARAARNVKIDDLLPPRAVLTVDERNKPLIKIKVEARASTSEQPIVALRLLLDGRPVPGKETIVEFVEGKQDATVEWDFHLPEGEHHLAVLARSKDSSNTSESVLVKNNFAAKLPVLHVLSVGINEYRDGSLNLQFAEPDATALARSFAINCKGRPFRDVRAHSLVNEKATTKNVVNKLIEMRKEVKQQDLVVVFFAGHGVRHKDEYFLLTHEANIDDLPGTALSGTELRSVLAQFKGQVLLMLDACHAAGFGPGQKLAQMGLRPATDDLTRDLTELEYGVAVLCASMAHEKAEGKEGHGLFTRAVLDVLEKKAGVHSHPLDQRVYVHHLHGYVFDMVSIRSENRQHPFLSLPWTVESFVVR